MSKDSGLNKSNQFEFINNKFPRIKAPIKDQKLKENFSNIDILSKFIFILETLFVLKDYRRIN